MQNINTSCFTVKDELDKLQERRCTALWRAVLLQVLVDIKQNIKRSENITAKQTSKMWLKEDNDAFTNVCYFARSDKRNIMSIAKKLIENDNLKQKLDSKTAN